MAVLRPRAAPGVATAVDGPAARALTPEIVPADLLPGAVALRRVAGQAAVVVGPAVGGVIFALEPEPVYIDAASLFARRPSSESSVVRGRESP